MRFNIALLAASSLFCLPKAALAWADGGHKAIAIIVWEKLGENERAWVTDILKQHPLWDEHFAVPMAEELGANPDESTRQKWLFAQAAVWPDIIRGPRGARVNPWEKWHRPTWHYIDYPIFASPEARAAMGDKVKPGAMDWQPGRANFLEARLNVVQTIKKALHDLADPSLPAPDRAVMLCWLFHLVGDIHQPCHSATLFDPAKLATGDRGANGTTIEGLPSSPLHAYWDDLLNGPGASFPTATKTAAALLEDEALAQAASTNAKELAPEVWAQESNGIASLHVYTPAVLASLSSAQTSSYSRNGQTYSSVILRLSDSDLATYKKEALSIARHRALIAALRLTAQVRAIANAPMSR